MKVAKMYTCFLLLMLISMTAKSQYNIKNARGFEGYVGVNESGIESAVGIYYSASKNLKVSTKIGSTYSSQHEVTYNPFFLSIKTAYGLMANGRRKGFVTNVVGGFILQYDRVVGKFDPDDGLKMGEMNYGLEGGLETEASIGRYSSIFVQGSLRYFVKSSFGQFRYGIGLGVRRNF